MAFQWLRNLLSAEETPQQPVRQTAPRPSTRDNLLPHNIIELMEAWGHSYDFNQNGNGDVELYERRLKPVVFNVTIEQPTPFFDALWAAVKNAPGWAQYGAARWLIDFSPLPTTHESRLHIMDAGLRFARRQNWPSAALPGYMWQRWLETHPDTNWLDWRPEA